MELSHLQVQKKLEIAYWAWGIGDFLVPGLDPFLTI